MPRKIIKTELATIPQVKAILKSLGEEQLDQFQRRTLDYATKFSKVDAETAKKLVKELMEKFVLEEEEAVQIVNCMPKSIEEIRVFLAGGRKIVETSKIEAILSVLDEYGEKKKEA